MFPDHLDKNRHSVAESFKRASTL